MHSPRLFASAALLGLLSGLFLAGMTPTVIKPMQQGEWRNRTAALQHESAAIYAYSMPEDLSPQMGFGNPAVHDAYARVVYLPGSASPPTPPLPPAIEVLQPRPAPATGNEATIAEFDALNTELEGAVAPAEPAPEPELQPPEANGG